MPITEELKNIKKLESVGFDHKQAEALTDIIEQAQVSSHESLKEFIHNEIKNLRNELKADIVISSKDILVKLFGVIVGTVGVAVAILKLFP